MVLRTRFWLMLALLCVWGSSWAQEYDKKALTESLASDVWLSDWENALWNLEHGADPNAKVEDGTPVLAECMRENPSFAKALIERGADPNTMGSWGWPVLCSAATVNLELTKLLLDRGADLQAKTKDGYSPLTAAAMADRPEVVSFLLQRGLPLEGRSEIGDSSDRLRGATPLMVAAKHGAAASMKALLDAGADPKALSADGVPPLAYALSGYANIASTDAEREAQAAKVNAAMGLLLDRGAPIDQRTACLFFYPGSSWNPLDGHGTVSGKDRSFTPLMIAASFQWYSAIKFLVARGADPNLRSEGGIPALFWACHYEGNGPLLVLLAAGADPNIEGNMPGYMRNKGLTPLMVAAAAGSDVAVQVLLKAGADPSRVSEEGIPVVAFPWINWGRVTPKKSAQIAQRLLDAGADPNGRPSQQEPGRAWLPPLKAISIAEGNSCEGTLWLLDHGADPRQAGSDGKSLCDQYARFPIPEEQISKLPECMARLISLCR